MKGALRGSKNELESSGSRVEGSRSKAKRSEKILRRDPPPFVGSPLPLTSLNVARNAFSHTDENQAAPIFISVKERPRCLCSIHGLHRNYRCFSILLPTLLLLFLLSFSLAFPSFFLFSSPRLPFPSLTPFHGEIFITGPRHAVKSFRRPRIRDNITRNNKMIIKMVMEDRRGNVRVSWRLILVTRLHSTYIFTQTSGEVLY